MKKLLPLSALLVTVFATPAFAHDQGDMKGWINHLFTEADSDGNGTISKEEYLDFAEKQFDKMDTNQDEELTKAEVMQYKKMEMKKHHMKHSTSKGSHEPVDDQDRVDTSKDAKSNSKNGSDNGQ